MRAEHPVTINQARILAEIAAQWLQVMSFASYPGAPVFGPNMCHYDAMLDPDSTDAARLDSCRVMLGAVREKIVLEEHSAQSRWARERPVDPYGKAWRTTRDGAALAMIAHLLSVAVARLERAEKQS